MLVLQELALDIGDFSFHVVDLQKKLTEKQEGEKASGDSFEHFVLFLNVCGNYTQVMVTWTNI